MKIEVSTPFGEIITIPDVIANNLKFLSTGECFVIGTGKNAKWFRILKKQIDNNDFCIFVEKLN